MLRILTPLFLLNSLLIAMKADIIPLKEGKKVFEAFREGKDELKKGVFGQEAFWTLDGKEILCNTRYTNKEGDAVIGNIMNATPITGSTREYERIGFFNMAVLKAGSKNNALFWYHDRKEPLDIFAPHISLSADTPDRIPETLPLGKEYRITQASWAPNGKKIAIVAQNTENKDIFFKVFSINSDAPVTEEKTFFNTKLTAPIKSFNWDHTSNLILALQAKKIFIFKGCGGFLLTIIKCEPGTHSAYWSPTEHKIVTATQVSAKSTIDSVGVRLWDLTDTIALKKDDFK